MYLIENLTMNVRSSVFQFISSNRDIQSRGQKEDIIPLN